MGFWGRNKGVAIKSVPDGLDGRPVERDRAVFPGLGLLEFQGIADLDVAYLTEPDREEFVGPIGGIHAQGKQAQVPRRIAEYLLNVLNRLLGADRFDFDTRSRLWTVGIVTFGKRHGVPAESIKFWAYKNKT